ncbi:MAG: ABC transporter substrate-binding protein [Candidatus Desulfofervidaceae bacterium]|nr:ABC transporter substrate-binding protein [Candidatus Desulfofervidaceae bacterium]MDL1969478.1 ABC transporter substrate-binding protein [Candidatus Desulfofervidaceae bacterium]
MLRLCVTAIFIYFFVFSAVVFAYDPGITDTQIVIGTSAALTGHAAFLGKNIVYGLRTYFNYINDRGGIYGRKIVHIAYDDDYNPPLMISNVRRLIHKDHIFALMGLVGTPTTLAVLKIVEESKIPLLCPFTGAQQLRYPFKKYVINLRASYWDECAAAVDYFVKHGKRRFAVFYQQDAYGLNGRQGVDRRLIKYDLRLVGEATYTRGCTDVRKQVAMLKQFNPDAIAMIGTYDACAAFIKEAVNQGMGNVWFFNVSFVGSDKLAALLKDTKATVFVTQVVPFPTDNSLPAVREYQELLNIYFPRVKPNFTCLEGFLDAKLFVEALKRAGPALTRENLIKAIESMHNLDLGIGEKVNFGSADHQGLSKVYITQIKHGQIIPVSD